MGWEDTISSDSAVTDRWEWRMRTAKSEADSTAPSFKDVWQIINPLQHIPIVGSIYRAITGDKITPTARAVGGLIYGGPVGLLTAGIGSLATEVAGGDPLERAVAKATGTDDAKDAPQVAGSETTRDDKPAEQAAAAAAPKPEVQTASAGPAATVDPYAKFQPKRVSTPQGQRVALMLAALPPATAADAKATDTKASDTKPGPANEPQPLTARTAAPQPATATDAPKATDPKQTPTSASLNGERLLTQSREFATGKMAAPDAANGGQTPPWFSQAVLGALDRYREAGGLRPPTATGKPLDLRR